MSSKTYNKVCEICGKPFEARRKDARYCSQECGVKAAQMRAAANPANIVVEEKGLQGTSSTTTPKTPPPQVENVINMITDNVREVVKEEIKTALDNYYPRTYSTTVKHQDTAASWMGVAGTAIGLGQNGAIMTKLDKVLKELDQINRQIGGLSLENKVLKRALKCFNITCKYANNQYYTGYVFGHKDPLDPKTTIFEDANGVVRFTEKMP
ncbi:MAG: hypothetical protein II165_01580 [Bacteroidales bacterium]|nr:hypothetical protein [Bacteroidales bacterium]